MKPVIGITSSYAKISEFSEGVYIHHDYHRAIEASGGIPLILPLVHPDLFLETLDLCDGVIFSGGEDVAPQFYGEEPHQNLEMVSFDRDRMEIAGIQKVISQDKPLLAICRGIQVLNVALGGTLFQDLPSQYPGALQHRQKIPRPLATHSVKVNGDSKLAYIIGQREIRVNSLHHQAINQVAPSLTVVGRSPDGVVEAVEDPSKGFLIGVQWHPESMFPWDPNAKALFQEFVRRSAERKNLMTI